ncbi:5221_t:CDS:2, partial [Gigaspora margarita]
MHLESESDENKSFVNWLLDIGNGSNTSQLQNTILLSKYIKVEPDIQSLIKAVYSNIEQQNLSDDFLQDRMLLSARNDDVQDINNIVLDIFPGHKYTYLSADNIIIEDGADNTNVYPIEYLNSLNPSGMPPSKLDLKIGCPIMLLHNLAHRQGICNGFRLIVVQLSDHVIEARILSGSCAENLAFIPRITLTPSSTELLFKFKRRQFPVWCAFAITINKSQGQSLKHVGLDLRTSVFSHGQLYIALSRCTSAQSIK